MNPSPQDLSFQNWVNEQFKKYRNSESSGSIEALEDICKPVASMKLIPKGYQRFVGDYISQTGQSLLVYHQLGSGKTLTLVTAMNRIAAAIDLNIYGPDGIETVIITPGSLRENIAEYVRDYYEYDYPVRYVTYNASNFAKQATRRSPKKNRFAGPNSGSPFDNCLVIVDECHVFFRNVVSGGAQQAFEVYRMMVEAKNCRFIFATATPIVGDPFELVPLFNLLYSSGLGSSNGGGDNPEPKEAKSLKEIEKKNTLFPIMRKDFYEYFASDEFNAVRNKAVFIERIIGMVSFYAGIHDPQGHVVPRRQDDIVVQVPMGNYQWNMYLEMRKEEWTFERQSKFSKKSFKEAVYKKSKRESIGTFKINTAQACNFVFPESINKQFEVLKANESIKKVSEEKLRLLSKMPNWEQFLDTNISDLGSKLARIVENITQTNKKLFVFSRFNVIGVHIISAILRARGYHEINEVDLRTFAAGGSLPKRKAFMRLGGDTKGVSDYVRLFNIPENKRGEICQMVIGTTVVSTGVTFKNLREIHLVEPQWRSMDHEQAAGRGIRTCSHYDLPIEERSIQIYYYIATVPADSKAAVIQDEGRSTDEFLYDVSRERDAFIETFLDTLKEASIDCEINRESHANYTCYTCPDQNGNRKRFPADFRLHIINGPTCRVAADRIRQETLMKVTRGGETFYIDSSDNVFVKTSSGILKEYGYYSEGRIHKTEVSNDLIF